MVPNLKQQVAEAWKNVFSLTTQLVRLGEPWEPPMPGPPATPAELAELEHHLGRALSPSYRLFLELHNGVKNFEYDMPLLSTSEVISCRGYWVEDAAEEHPELTGAPIAGSDYTYAGSYFLDYGSKPSNGEVAVVLLSMAGDITRWPSFLELLRDRSERLQILLEGRHRQDSNLRPSG